MASITGLNIIQFPCPVNDKTNRSSFLISDPIFPRDRISLENDKTSYPIDKITPEKERASYPLR
jgi:hypothetical protein